MFAAVLMKTAKDGGDHCAGAIMVVRRRGEGLAVPCASPKLASSIKVPPTCKAFKTDLLNFGQVGAAVRT